jgi:hypothetical protein
MNLFILLPCYLTIGTKKAWERATTQFIEISILIFNSFWVILACTYEVGVPCDWDI